MSLSVITKQCKRCGVEFQVKKGPNAAKRTYCGNACRYASLSESLRTPDRACELCGKMFHPNFPEHRFCDKRCSQKFIAPEYHRRAMIPGPTRDANIARLKEVSLFSTEEGRQRFREIAKEKGHSPKVRGGNGKSMPLPQMLLAVAMNGSLIPEYVAKAGLKRDGRPMYYKIDLAEPNKKLAVEIDGDSHRAYARREQDQRKEAALTAQGWRVLRFKNAEVLNSLQSVMDKIRSLCTI